MARSEGMEARVISPKTYEQLKNVFGQFDAADAIQKRASLNAEVYAAIRGAVRGPIVIDSVQVEDITFSTQYEDAVEARMQAIVKQQQAEADKQKRIIDADAAAYEVKAAADAKRTRSKSRVLLKPAQSRRGAMPCATIRAFRRSLQRKNGMACFLPRWCRATRCRFSISQNNRRDLRVRSWRNITIPAARNGGL